MCEFYADLDYNDEGRNVITREHHSVAPLVAAEKVRRAVLDGTTTSLSGKTVGVVAQSVCVHSDTPNAVEIARAVHGALTEFI